MPWLCQEVTEQLAPGLALRLALMPRQHCHTASHTALMVWQAARPLAQLLLSCPGYFQCEEPALHTAAAACLLCTHHACTEAWGVPFHRNQARLVHPDHTMFA
jgi:hypothetical protein